MEKQIKVLLVDNSEHFGAPCAQTMQDCGLCVETIEKDGKKAVDAICTLHPDVVLMDFFLPRLDAIGVIKSIYTRSLTRIPQFMVMSGFDNPNMERCGHSAAALPFFAQIIWFRTLRTSASAPAHALPAAPDGFPPAAAPECPRSFSAAPR